MTNPMQKYTNNQLLNQLTLNELIQLRKLIEKVEQDINRPLWMQFEDELRTVWDFLTLKFMRKSR